MNNQHGHWVSGLDVDVWKRTVNDFLTPTLFLSKILENSVGLFGTHIYLGKKEIKAGSKGTQHRPYIP